MSIKKALLAAGASALIGFSTPAAAYGDSAILMMILEQAIAQLTQQQTINDSVEDGLENVEGAVKDVEGTIKAESEASARSVINGQRDIYNRQLELDQQAATFCQQDQTAPTQIGKSAMQRAYATQSTQFNRYNSQSAVSDPAKFIKSINDEAATRVTPSCDPRVMPPVGKKDVSQGMTCSPEQVETMVSIVTGRSVLPELPPSAQETAFGVEVRKENNAYNSRMSAIDGALAHSASEELDTQISAYQKLFATPSIEELNNMAGKGGVERDQLVLMQIQGQLLLNIYRESVEQKRLLAIIAAQGQEAHRARISALSQAATQRYGDRQ